MTVRESVHTVVVHYEVSTWITKLENIRNDIVWELGMLWAPVDDGQPRSVMYILSAKAQKLPSLLRWIQTWQRKWMETELGQKKINCLYKTNSVARKTLESLLLHFSFRTYCLSSSDLQGRRKFLTSRQAFHKERFLQSCESFCWTFFI